ncbi:YkvA family protein [Streptomyces sp. NPDC101062]|uniref:YkvA family protein n=1 Tax=unclassified Streptomyces TaxID=2593676 RepID=UPI002E787124|nr:YkvA family protein [Streptomyces sp. JV176]MEE1803455.1 YkvA family protein [Streptomyces sp. JV176]
MSELQILVAVAVVLVVLTLGAAIVLAVRLVRARGVLRKAGVPPTKKWLFWAALGYLVLPVDLLPDPVYLDDIGVLLMALRSLHADHPEREKRAGAVKG